MKIRVLIVIVYSSIFLSGCATMPSPEQAVAVRANERMDLILQGEVLEAYTYLSPGYRSSVSPEAYIRQMMVRQGEWAASELLATECDISHCSVRFKIDYVLHSPVPGIRKFDFFSDIEENWVNTQGQWWYVPKN